MKRKGMNCYAPFNRLSHCISTAILDPEIEKQLCERLYKIYSDDADPYRRFITEAMRDVGTVNVLPTLEAILFQLRSTAQVKQIIGDALVKSSEDPAVVAEAVVYGVETGSKSVLLS